MSAQWVPRHQLKAHLVAGWHLFPGMDYRPNEYAFFMWLGPRPTPAEVAAIMRPYQARDARRSNRSQAAYSCWISGGKKPIGQ